MKINQTGNKDNVDRVVILIVVFFPNIFLRVRRESCNKNHVLSKQERFDKTIN